MSDARPAFEYLLACSEASLESYRISRMNQAANLRKQVRALVDEWVRAEVDAGLSRWMLECRHTDAMPPLLEMDCLPPNRFQEHVRISFLPKRVELSTVASHPARLSTGVAKVEDAGACLLLEDGTVTRPVQTESRKPYARPVARRRLTSCLEGAGVTAMPVCSSPQAQREFEFEGPLFSAAETGQEAETTAWRAAVGGYSSAMENPSQQADRSVASVARGSIDKMSAI
jgi:hypothetical protein